MKPRTLDDITTAMLENKGTVFMAGFLQATNLLDEMFASAQSHKFLLGDCLLWKLNYLKQNRRVRPNKRRANFG